MIIDMIAMPDVRMICVASSERELRFYDTTINKFELRMRVSRKINESVDKLINHFLYFRYTIFELQ